MQLLDAGSQLGSRPTPNATVSPGWANNAPSGSLPATIADPDCWNAIMAEMVAFLTAAGLSPSKTNVSQLLTSAIALLSAPAGNILYNGSCQVAQRGTSVSVSAGTSAFTLDGMIVGCTGAGVTVSQAGPNTGAFSPNGITITGAAGVTDAYLILPIESVMANRVAGRPAIWQAKLLNNTGGSFTPTLTMKHPTAVDTWSASSTDVSAASLVACPNSALTQLSWYGTPPVGCANGQSIRIDFGGALNGSGNAVTIWDNDERPGGGPLPQLPNPQARLYYDELLFCQRYYYSLFGPGYNLPNAAVQGSGTSATGFITINFPTDMRVKPTGIAFRSLSDFTIGYNATAYTPTALTFNNGFLNGCNFAFNDTAHSYTANTAAGFAIASGAASNAFLAFTGAEINGTAI